MFFFFLQTTIEAQDGSPESACGEPSYASSTDQVTTKERITDHKEDAFVDSSTDGTQDAVEQCPESSVIGQKSDETEESKVTIPETVSNDRITSCTSDQITTSDEPSHDEGTTSCEKVESSVSMRRTRGRATVSSDALLVGVKTSTRRTRSHIGTVDSDASNSAELKVARTRRRATMSTDAAEVTTPVVGAKTKGSVSCDTGKVINASLLTPQRTRNEPVVSCDVRKDVMKRAKRRQTRSMETIPCDSPTGAAPSINVPVTQTDGCISCDAPRVTRSRLKTGAVCEPVWKKSACTSNRRASEENDKKTGETFGGIKSVLVRTSGI